jgi:type VI secretion system FHA domain protein
MIALRILQRPDGAPSGPPLHAVSTAGATIGRAPDCDIVLDDPTRLVSRRHAWIASDGQGHALLRCLSTISPMTVNDERLPASHERVLRVGDRVRIGGFDLSIESLDGAAAVTRADPYAATMTATPYRKGDPPGHQIGSPVSSPSGSPAGSPFGSLVGSPLGSPVGNAVSNAIGDPVASPASHRVNRPVPPALRPAPPVPAARLDRWFDLDTVPDPLGPDSPLPALNTAAARGLPGAPLPGPPAAPGAADPGWPPTLLMPRIAPEALAAETAAAVRADFEALRNAFLRGAGLDPETSPFTLDATTLAHLGALLRAQTEGTLELLRARALTKRNLRAKGTSVTARENNLLKFTPDTDEALRLLLEPTGRAGFLPPVAAVRAAHHDLQVHQLAMAAGMRAAMLDLIKQLGPAAIEAQADPPQGAARVMPALREAQLWQRLQQAHQRLVEQLDDTFDNAFGREFVRAYEACAAQARAEPPAEGDPAIRH